MTLLKKLCLLFCGLLCLAFPARAVAPLAGGNPKGHGPVYAQGCVVALEGIREVDAYVRAALPYCPPCLRMRVEDSVKEGELELFLEELLTITGLHCTEARLLGDELVLRFAYDERVLIMSRYRSFVDGDEEAWLYEGRLYAEEAQLASVYEGMAENASRRRSARQKMRQQLRLKRRDEFLQKEPVIVPAGRTAACPEIDNLRDACCYVISAMPYCPNTLRFYFPRKLSYEDFMELEKATGIICASLMQHVRLVPPRRWSKNEHVGSDEAVTIKRNDHSQFPRHSARQLPDGRVEISFKHDISALFLAVYRGKLPESCLSANQSALYELVRSMADEAKKLHPMEYHRAVALHDAMLREFTVYPRKRQMPFSPDNWSLLQLYKGIHGQYAELYALLCAMVDINVVPVRGALDISPSMASVLNVDDLFSCDYESESGKVRWCGKATHSWNMLYLDGVWAHVDVFCDDLRPARDEAPHHGFFGLTDEMLAHEAQGRLPSPVSDTLIHGIDARMVDVNRLWGWEEFPQAVDKSALYKNKFANRFSTISQMVQEARKQHHAARRSIMLSAHVDEVAKMSSLVTQPEVVRETLLRALGADEGIVDFTEDGKVSILLE